MSWSVCLYIGPVATSPILHVSANESKPQLKNEAMALIISECMLRSESTYRLSTMRTVKTIRRQLYRRISKHQVTSGEDPPKGGRVEGQPIKWQLGGGGVSGAQHCDKLEKGKRNVAAFNSHL